MNPNLISFNKDDKKENNAVLEYIKSLNLTSELTCKNYKEFKKKMDEYYAKPLNVERANQIFMYKLINKNPLYS